MLPNNNYCKELYLFKTLRILKGQKALNIESILTAVKEFLKKRSQAKV